MHRASDGPRALTNDDLEWVLDISGHRRERIAGFGPRFWRPAPDARDRHREFLSHQIQDPQVVSLRTDHGFVFAAPRGDELDVDDMALDDDNLWTRDGSGLIMAVLERSDLRFVCPVAEPARTKFAIDLGMSLDQTWWHRDLPAKVSAAAHDRAIAVKGAAGRLIKAPPVYDPGGPVLLVFDVDGAAGLAAIEHATAPAVVSVVSRKPDQPTEFLTKVGYKRTTDFFTWCR